MSGTKTRLLAIDPGARRTGLAATDETGTLCLPLPILEHEGMAGLPDLLDPILEERRTQCLIVGVPLGQGGEAGPQARKVLGLVDRLRARFPDLEIRTLDESFTSDLAHERLRKAGVKAAQRKGRVDSLAALEILRRFLGED